MITIIRIETSDEVRAQIAESILGRRPTQLASRAEVEKIVRDSFAQVIQRGEAAATEGQQPPGSKSGEPAPRSISLNDIRSLNAIEPGDIQLKARLDGILHQLLNPPTPTPDDEDA